MISIAADGPACKAGWRARSAVARIRISASPSARRGGKAVKYYRLTEEGYKALAEIKKIHDIMWQAFSVPVSEER